MQAVKAILMHNRKKCQPNIWLLSGTGEGPYLANALLQKGWKVSVSVVSCQASLAYKGIPLEQLYVGALNGVEGICTVINDSNKNNRGFDYIIDATHPFATSITSNLKIACERLGQSFIRYERSIEEINEARLIKSLKELESIDLSGQKILLAIGSRFLPEAVHSLKIAGAKVFARVLPTVDGLTKAFASEISQENIAVVRPSSGGKNGFIERSICRKWGISGVVTRESGGLNQKTWHQICKLENLDLWLIKRPLLPSGIETIFTVNELIKRIEFKIL